MTEVSDRSTLAAVVDGLVEALEKLSTDLGKEREALTRRASVGDLESIALRKGEAVEHVAGLYSQLRRSLVDATGGNDVSHALGQLKAHAPDLSVQVDRLVELTRACQLANQENGALIGAGLRSSHSALEGLRKLAATDSAGTYSASGQPDAGEGSASQLTVRA